MKDLLDVVIDKIRDAVSGTVIDVGGAYQSDQIDAGTVVVTMEYGAGGNHPGISTVRARIDVWERGPSTVEADETAAKVIEVLDGVGLSSDRQLFCWLTLDSKTADAGEDDLARVILQFTGRAVRARWAKNGG